jgi:histidinol-phosphate aminotransferase
VINDDDFVNKVAENNRQGMKLLVDFFEKQGLDYIPSKGNFITVDFKQPALPIYDALLHKGIIVRPIAGYGMPNHLRISIGLPEENQAFIDALTEILAN